MPLRGLFELGDHVLVSRADLPEAHAYLIVRTLDLKRESLLSDTTPLRPAEHAAVPPHDGVTTYRNGDPPPAVSPATASPQHSVD